MSHAYIIDAVRTPRGKGKRGSLYETKPVDLATQLLNALQERNGFIARELDDVILGCVTPLGDQGGNIAKTAVNTSRLGYGACGLQINRFCASGLEAVNLAAQKVMSGWQQVVVAGGVESMSRIPMGSDLGPWAFDPKTSLDTNFVPQGVAADLIATLDGYSRSQVDEYALLSQRRAREAWQKGRFGKSLVPVRDAAGQVVLERDELIRADASMAALSQLSPSFAMPGKLGFDAVAQQRYPDVEFIDHVHTAGNSSGVVDGAAAVLVAGDNAVKTYGLKPRARVLAGALVGTEPTIMLTGPVPATRKALAQAGLELGQIDLFEVNEAFSAVPLRFMKELGVPVSKVNVNGGAIAMGHPLGATGAMLIATLLDELERQELRYGVATLCVGGGMGIATVIERL